MLQTLSPEQCQALLAGCTVGRLAVTVEDQPQVVPVNYATEGTTVVFRTAPDTILNEAALHRVAFEVDSVDERTRTGWSVCVHGYGREITDCVDDESRHLLDLKVDTWAPEGRDRWFKIETQSITGRYLGPVKPED